MSNWYGHNSDLGLYGAFDAYGTLNLTQNSPIQNFIEPLTVQEVFDYMRIPMAAEDTAEYNLVQVFISAAREQAEIAQNKDLVVKQWDKTHDYWPSYRIETRTPLVTVDLVQYTDSDGNITVMQPGTGANQYAVDTSKQPGIITPPYNGVWPTFTPWPTSALLFRFTSGYANCDPFWRDAGARIKVGMKLLISAWYNNRMPFEIGAAAAEEYPYAVTSCLSYGAAVRAR